MSNRRRFLDWPQLAPQQRAVAASTAISRATRLQERLQAFVELSAARDPSPKTGPLAFLPYAAKDLFFAPNHRPRCGLATAIEPVRQAYAEPLRDLDEAGATRIGFTAMTALAYEPSGFNAVADYPRNPWDCDFIPGGSSSGSAVAVSSGMSVVALGSDTGGSIRIPTHCCGVTGFKPSWGAINVTGTVSLAPFLDCVGLLARSAADLAPAAEMLLSNAPPPAVIENIVVFGDVLDAAERPIRRACQDGIDLIGTLPVTVSRVDALSAIVRIDEHALIIMQGEAARTHASRLDHPALDPVLRKRLAKGLSIDEETLAASRKMRAPLLKDFEDKILGSADAAVLPVMPIRTPAYIDVDPASPSFSGRRLYDLSRYCRFVNMLGVPAIALPVGFDDRGLPVALQLIGRRGRDRDLIAFVAAIQKRSDWHGSVPDAIHDLIETDEGLCA